MHIGHLALRVADIDAYVGHITEVLGLTVLEQTSDEAFLGSQATRHELQLIRADAPAFDHVGLMVETEAEFDAAVQSAVDAGAHVSDAFAGERGCVRSAHLVGPAGVAHQLYVPEVRVPLALSVKLGAGIRRLGHLTFFSNEADALVRFWSDGLGFRISDEATGFTWMRCDPYHHTLAVGAHPAATLLHHHAWETQDVTSLTKHCDVNGAAARPQTWGPTRHGPGLNLAAYMPDAAGALIEVYADLLIIDDDANYVPMDWSDEPLALNLWGQMPSPDFFAAGAPVIA
jgi:catechol-2,3-dioxygenase